MGHESVQTLSAGIPLSNFGNCKNASHTLQYVGESAGGPQTPPCYGRLVVRMSGGALSWRFQISSCRGLKMSLFNKFKQSRRSAGAPADIKLVKV